MPLSTPASLTTEPELVLPRSCRWTAGWMTTAPLELPALPRWMWKAVGLVTFFPLHEVVHAVALDAELRDRQAVPVVDLLTQLRTWSLRRTHWRSRNSGRTGHRGAAERGRGSSITPAGAAAEAVAAPASSAAAVTAAPRSRRLPAIRPTMRREIRLQYRTCYKRCSSGPHLEVEHRSSTPQRRWGGAGFPVFIVNPHRVERAPNATQRLKLP